MGIVIGIDASNLLQGGGRTHMVGLLREADPAVHGFCRIVVWGATSTLAQLDEAPWLEKICPPDLDGGFIKRGLWQRYRLGELARQAGCDVLFVPGGSVYTKFCPVITMCRNMLPFEWTELCRFGISSTTLRLIFLRRTQSSSFRRADGVIFLTKYAQETVEPITGVLRKSVVIPHGLDGRFSRCPTVHRSIETCSNTDPFRILYVSIIDQYKHQWHVVEAVSDLRRKTGWPLTLDLVGPAHPPSMDRLQSVVKHHDPAKSWVHYHGSVSFDSLHTIYHKADMGLFASSCENMPNILLETMAAGLPVACSNRGPMPEILKDAGAYFDPENPGDIARAIESLILDRQLRSHYAILSFSASQQYTWRACAEQTFAFISAVYWHHVRGQTVCAE